jgi:hypothetical protein
MAQIYNGSTAPGAHSWMTSRLSRNDWHFSTRISLPLAPLKPSRNPGCVRHLHSDHKQPISIEKAQGRKKREIVAIGQEGMELAELQSLALEDKSK